MLRTGMARRALVIGAETFSRILDWEDRTTCVLFGDGAGAIVLEAIEVADDGPGVLATRLHADGDRKSVVSGKSVSVRVDLGGCRSLKKKQKSTLTRHKYENRKVTYSKRK